MTTPYVVPPTAISEGGSLYDQMWVRFTAVKPVMTDKFKKTTPVLEITLTELESGDSHTELLMAGSADNWMVEGNVFKSINPKVTSFSKRNDVGKLAMMLSDAGFPWDLPNYENTGWSQLNGHLFWAERYELKDRDGKAIPSKKDGQATGFNKTGIMFTKWGGNGSAPSDAPSNTAPVEQATSGPEITTQDKALVEAAIVAILDGGPKPANELNSLIFANPPIELPKVTTLVGGPWFKDGARLWVYGADGVVTKK